MQTDTALFELLDPAEELEAAKASPEGAWLSPAAQALYEAEGAARFARCHRRGWFAASLATQTPAQTPKEGA